MIDTPRPPLTYLSLGAGVQSSALLVMSALGLKGCPRADFAVFADTGDEPAWVYRQLETLREFLMTNAPNLPIEVVRYGCLSDDILHKRSGQRARIPLFIRNPDGSRGMINRQCTSAYKIEPIEQLIRQKLGVARGRRVPKAIRVTALIGISFDERDRMKDSQRPWIMTRWPLIENVMRRHDCELLLREFGLPIPGKSACVFCPFHSDAYWHNLKINHPEEFAKAVQFDANIRREKSFTSQAGEPFLHQSLRPLADVEFAVETSFDGFGNECSGHCGV